MNTLLAVVKQIDNVENLNIVHFDFDGDTLIMMSLDLTDNIKVGTEVKLITKPSHIAIAKEFTGVVSHSNQLKAKIVYIDNGKLLSSIKLQIKESILESIITVNSSQNMNLKVADEVTVFIKASELSIRLLQ